MHKSHSAYSPATCLALLQISLHCRTAGRQKGFPEASKLAMSLFFTSVKKLLGQTLHKAKGQTCTRLNGRARLTYGLPPMVKFEEFSLDQISASFLIAISCSKVVFSSSILLSKIA